MKQLGTTARLVGSSPLLDARQQQLLTKWLKETCPTTDYEAFLDSDMVTGDHCTGGYVYLIEDTAEDFLKMRELGGLPDLRLKESPGLDFTDTLGNDELYVLGVCNSTDGGPAFMLTSGIFNKYPTIGWHIEHAYDWLDRVRDVSL